MLCHRRMSREKEEKACQTVVTSCTCNYSFAHLPMSPSDLTSASIARNDSDFCYHIGHLRNKEGERKGKGKQLRGYLGSKYAYLQEK